ncbi:MAG: ABC transporter ATP-binding protein [Longimicrobiales bacterium]
MTAILQTQALHKHFGGLAAVSDVNFEIAVGEIHCLIGPNGAGKSTLFKLIAGTYAPSGGEVLFQGEKVTHRKPYERVGRGMSIKLQVPSIFRELPVAQNLEIAVQRKSSGSAMEAEKARLLEFLQLEDAAGKLAGILSHGQQQWLEIGMALALQPTLLLLDEPTAGMSPQETERTGELIQRLNAQGMTVLVVEHDMTFVRQIAQRITVLHLGRVFAQGSTDAVIADPRVEEIYLGKGHVD